MALVTVHRVDGKSSEQESGCVVCVSAVVRMPALDTGTVFPGWPVWSLCSDQH